MYRIVVFCSLIINHRLKHIFITMDLISSDNSDYPSRDSVWANSTMPNQELLGMSQINLHYDWKFCTTCKEFISIDESSDYCENCRAFDNKRIPKTVQTPIGLVTIKRNQSLTNGPQRAAPVGINTVNLDY